MERKSAGGAIRLTNKTAIALRESARTARRTGVVVGVVLTAGLAAASVWCGNFALSKRGTEKGTAGRDVRVPGPGVAAGTGTAGR